MVKVPLAFKFVSGEERRPSEAQRVSRGWRLPGATHSSADLTWIRKGLEIDEFRMVSGGQPTPCFFHKGIHEKQFFTLPVVNDNEIVRSTSDGVEGKQV